MKSQARSRPYLGLVAGGAHLHFDSRCRSPGWQLLCDNTSAPHFPYIEVGESESNAFPRRRRLCDFAVVLDAAYTRLFSRREDRHRRIAPDAATPDSAGHNCPRSLHGEGAIHWHAKEIVCGSFVLACCCRCANGIAELRQPCARDRRNGDDFAFRK